MNPSAESGQWFFQRGLKEPRSTASADAAKDHRDMSHKEILITGGLGFIGTAVTEQFLGSGASVTIVDSGISNVVEPDFFEDPSRVQFVDRTVLQYLDGKPDLSTFDLVIHAASYVGPAAILGYQGMLGPEIVASTASIVEACLEHDVPMVYFSSAEVYGRSGVLVEAGDIRVPPYYNARIEYALAKLTSEAVVLNNASNGLRSVVIRPFNVAGPLQSRAGGFVMPTFVQQALGGRPITVFESGEQKRAFLSSTDLAEFLTDYITPEVLEDPRVYNLGNPNNAISVLDLAHRIRDLLGSDSPIEMTSGADVYGPRYQEAESFQKLPDIERARELGWRPRRSLDDLIFETAEFYQHNPDTRGADARERVEAEDGRSETASGARV